MTLIQIFTIVLAVLILIKTVADFKKNKITLLVFLFWAILWLIIIAVATLSQVANFLDDVLGKGRGIDAVVYFSILLIFYILFRIVTKLEKIESNITAITRKIALRDKDR